MCHDLTRNGLESLERPEKTDGCIINSDKVIMFIKSIDFSISWIKIFGFHCWRKAVYE